MGKILKNNWLLIFTFIFLISIKFYFLYLTSLGNKYEKVEIYNSGDAGHYYEIAENIFKYYTYSDNDSSVASESATWRPPFWPFLLSTFFFISDIPLIVIIFKSLLEITLIISSLCFFRKKEELKYINFVPFLFLLIEPQYLKYSVTFLSESISSVLILMLSIIFIVRNEKYIYGILITILSGIIILCHPISVFFVIIFFGIYLLSLVKTNFKTFLMYGFLFSLIVFSWPFRNLKTFNEGFYFTASQGVTFSKGWNEMVLLEFNNVEGDLAAEGINLKFIDNSLLNPNNTYIENSKLYKIATNKFIATLSFSEKLKIAFKKIKSNFTPYPEKTKSVFIENVSTIFRILYLFVFLQMIYKLVRGKINFHSRNDRIFIIIFSIFLGQIFMSAYIYTGLRFNSIYGLTMLFAFLYLNMKYILKVVTLKKLIRLNVRLLT